MLFSWVILMSILTKLGPTTMKENQWVSFSRLFWPPQSKCWDCLPFSIFFLVGGGSSKGQDCAKWSNHFIFNEWEYQRSQGFVVEFKDTVLVTKSLKMIEVLEVRKICLVLKEKWLEDSATLFSSQCRASKRLMTLGAWGFNILQTVIK